ncbi:hypothetical protein I7I48_12010 [Histoplasma ohiense]|nr:hypothetical protein I7I48_12010 [Histoplasma ohiense (nom. inval.)]
MLSSHWLTLIFYHASVIYGPLLRTILWLAVSIRAQFLFFVSFSSFFFFSYMQFMCLEIHTGRMLCIK